MYFLNFLLHFSYLQTLVDRTPGQISLKDLLEIHKRVIGYVDPVEAGFFRQTQVFVGKHFHLAIMRRQVH